MVANKPFSEYLAEAKAKRGVSAANRVPKVTSFATVGKSSAPQDPLSWFVDILSRPMRTVENIPNQILNEELKRKQAEATGTPYNVVGGVVNVLTSPIRGFLSNNPEDQPTGAELIEKGYDVANYGKIGYVDEANNVNELQKGAGGLALDIALDPLTWIPGAQLAKGGQLAARGIKGAVTGADALIAGTNFGEAIGAGTRVATRAAKAKQTKIDTARQAADAQAEFLAENAPSARLQGTAFQGLVRPSENLTATASRIVNKATKDRFDLPSIPLSPLKEAPLGPLTKAENKASQRLAEAMKAENIAEEAASVVDEAVPSASLLDSLGPATGSTVGEQFQATGMLPQILAQIDTIQPKTTTAIAAPDEALAMTTQRLNVLKDQESRILAKGDLLSDTQTKTRNARLKDIRAEIKAVEADLKKANPKRQLEVTKRFSETAVLKQIVADPVKAKELADALSPAVVDKLSTIKDNAKLVRAVDFLGKYVRGEVAKGSSSLQNELAEAIRTQYDIKIPGTEVPALTGTSTVATERVAEAQVVEAAGKNLVDAPWLGGYSQEQIDTVASVMPGYLKDDFLKTETYPFTTDGGALSTSDTLGKGVHKYANEYNQWDQYSIGEALIKEYRARIKAWNMEVKDVTPAMMLAGNQRAGVLKDDYLKMLSLSFQWLDSKNVSVWMGQNDTRIRLYLHQMIETLNEVSRSSAAVKYDAIDRALFNTDTSVPLTNLMDAVVKLYLKPDVTDKELLAILKKDIKGADNFLNSKELGTWRHYATDKPPTGIKSKPNIDEGTGKLKGYYGLVDPKEFGDELVTLLREAAPAMDNVVLHNEEMALARNIADTTTLPPVVIDELWKAANDPAALGESVRKIANMVVDTAETGARNWANPRVAQIIAKPATDYWPNDVVHDAQHIMKLVKAGIKDNRDALVKQVTDNGAYAAKNAEEIVLLRGSMFEGIKDGRVINQPMAEDAINAQALNDLLREGSTTKFQQLFQYGKGKEQVIHPYNQAQIQMSMGIADFKLQVNKLINAHSQMFTEGTTVLQQAFRDIAMNKASAPQVAAARTDLEPLIWSIFGKPGDSEAVGIWQRAGASLEDIQAYMKKNKLDYQIDLSAAGKKMKEGMNAVEAGLDDWRLWIDEIGNPMEFLSDMYFAGSMLHMDKSAAALFVARAGVTSKKPKSGYVKIPQLNPFEHSLMSHMPKDTYIRKDILQEVNNLEKMLMSDYSPKSEFGKFFNEKYLPVLGAWKKGVTIYRLGHHVRNLLSSEGIQWTVEGTKYYTSSSTVATRVLMAHKNYDGVDWAQKLDDLVKREGRLEMPTGGTKVFTFGKKDITVDALYEAADKHGLFTDFRLIEDLFNETGGGSFESFVNKISLKDTAVEKMAGGLSEYQAHFSRLHHFSQILMKQAKSGKNWDEAVEAAAKKVRRHHPDGLTLTPFEQQVMKPLIPFYSWFRQVIPVIAEGIAQNPGRFMVYPKASYNLAVAMGVNPESLQDPFPADTLFPEFVTDQLTGPVLQIDGNYFKASPGYAYADILNQFVADPKQGALGMLTPFIKTPGELITGTRWDTGVSIKDYSDYIDAQIPGINYLSNFTGVSTTGSVASLLGGQGIDKQYAVDKGNKTLLDQGLSVSNWFTGLGLQNISKENYQNLAELEARDRAAEEAKRQAGTARSPF